MDTYLATCECSPDNLYFAGGKLRLPEDVRFRYEASSFIDGDAYLLETLTATVVEQILAIPGVIAVTVCSQGMSEWLTIDDAVWKTQRPALRRQALSIVSRILDIPASQQAHFQQSSELECWLAQAHHHPAA
jgi:hypothetical protein